MIQMDKITQAAMFYSHAQSLTVAAHVLRPGAVVLPGIKLLIKYFGKCETMLIEDMTPEEATAYKDMLRGKVTL